MANRLQGVAPHGGLKVRDLVRHGDDLCRVVHLYDGCDEIALTYASEPEDTWSFDVCWFDVDVVSGEAQPGMLKSGEGQ